MVGTRMLSCDVNSFGNSLLHLPDNIFNFDFKLKQVKFQFLQKTQENAIILYILVTTSWLLIIL